MSDYRWQQEAEEQRYTFLVETLARIEQVGLHEEARLLARELGIDYDRKYYDYEAA